MTDPLSQSGVSGPRPAFGLEHQGGGELDPRPALRPIFSMIGIACLLISIVWVGQALVLAPDARATLVTWVILGAVIAGLGAGFLIAARLWFQTDVGYAAPDDAG